MSKVRRVNDFKDDEEKFSASSDPITDFWLRIATEAAPRTSIVIRRNCFSCCGVSEERNFSNALGQLKIMLQVERRKSFVRSRIVCEVKRIGTDVFDVPHRHGKEVCVQVEDVRIFVGILLTKTNGIAGMKV